MKNHQASLPGRPGLMGALLLIATFIVGLLIWIAVQAFREESLPTLVWSPSLSDGQMMEKSPLVLDRLGHHWWWVYASRKERAALRDGGVSLAVAMPVPLATMAGCSMPPVLDAQIRP